MMGGIKEPLVINGKIMKELNFASDPRAIQTILTHGNELSIITGHVCLDALFCHDTYEQMTSFGECPIFSFIEKETRHWINHIGGIYKIDGFYNWDAVAAVFIDRPDLFDYKNELVVSSLEDLQTGFLRTDKKKGKRVLLPYRINDVQAFNDTLISAWGDVEI